jgi:hypothetical protein
MLAYDPETGLIYPVSVKTRAGEPGTRPASDNEANRDGGIVARIRYKLPRGVVRKIGNDNITANNKIEGTAEEEQQSKSDRFNSVFDFIKQFSPGDAIETQIVSSCCPMPRSSLHCVMTRMVKIGMLKKGRYGEWKILNINPPVKRP